MKPVYLVSVLNPQSKQVMMQGFWSPHKAEQQAIALQIKTRGSGVAIRTMRAIVTDPLTIYGIRITDEKKGAMVSFFARMEDRDKFWADVLEGGFEPSEGDGPIPGALDVLMGPIDVQKSDINLPQPKEDNDDLPIH